MYNARKITMSVLATLWMLSTSSLVLYGQNMAHKIHNKRSLTIGFERGGSTTFGNGVRLPKKANWNYGNKAVLRYPVNKHFKAEAGLDFSAPGKLSLSSQPGKYNLPLSHPSNLPVTFQYYPLPHHCRLQPYCGAGLQYNFTPLNTSVSAANEVNNAAPQSGTKYISIVFTQGVTYEINTKIELTQTFHFIPDANAKTIGFGIGIGYNIK